MAEEKDFRQQLLDIISETEKETRGMKTSVDEKEEEKTGSAAQAAEKTPDASMEFNGNGVIKQKTKAEMYENIHKGHRERVRFSVDRDPEFDSFSDHEVVEYLLFDTVTRVDTNPYAHQLIDYFGSLWGVLNANINELTKFPFINERTARRLREYIPVARRAEISRLKHNVILDTTLRAVTYLRSHLLYRNKEALYAAYLDVNDRLLSICKISEGDTSIVSIDFKRIAEAAFSSGAAKIVLAHNHPADTLSPSPDDINSTKRLCVAMLSMNILLVDHLIFTSDSHFSFFSNGLMDDVYSNCDLVIGSQICKQLRSRKSMSPEKYLLEKDYTHVYGAKTEEASAKYIRFNISELFAETKKDDKNS